MDTNEHGCEAKPSNDRHHILREHLARWEKVGGKIRELKEFEATIALNAGRFWLRVQVNGDGSLSLSRI